MIRQLIMNTKLSTLVDYSRIMLGRYRVRSSISHSNNKSSGLGKESFDILLNKYQNTNPGRSYEQSEINNRGMIAADKLLSMKSGKHANDFLEIGCGEGHIPGFLAYRGKNATGIDIDGSRFKSRYINFGAKLMVAKANSLPFNDETFDFVFSYSTFEHLHDLYGVLNEVFRVLRPNGHLFISFGPLYNSPYGLHAYHAIPVPYCQFLFEREMIDNYVETIGQDPIRYNELNGWSLNQYRELWSQFDRKLKLKKYREWSWLKNLDLVCQYPECFRGRIDNLDELFIATIQGLFKKIEK